MIEFGLFNGALSTTVCTVDWYVVEGKGSGLCEGNIGLPKFAWKTFLRIADVQTEI
jgi:hypothetical protein